MAGDGPHPLRHALPCPPGEVCVWQASLSADAERLAAWLDVLSPGERARVERLRSPEHRSHFIAAHGRETDAWYAAMNADPIASRKLAAVFAREAFLSVSVKTDRGWESRGIVWEAGPEISKRQAMRLDLAGVAGETVRVRLESVPLFWHLDQVAIDFSTQAAPKAITVEPQQVTLEADGSDLLAVMADVDGAELVLETGDAAELSFQVPPLAAGQSRSYLIATTGWYRIHTRSSQAPPRPELAWIGMEPGAVSRLAVARLNEALNMLEARAARTTKNARLDLDGRGGR